MTDPDPQVREAVRQDRRTRQAWHRYQNAVTTLANMVAELSPEQGTAYVEEIMRVAAEEAAARRGEHPGQTTIDDVVLPVIQQRHN